MRRHHLGFAWFACGALALIACGSSSDDSQVEGAAASAGASGNAGNATGGLSFIGVGGSDLSNAGADTCGGTKLVAAPAQVNVLLVVDKSSSMKSTPAGFGDTKWNALRAALSSAVDATNGSVAFGLDFFPSSGDASTPLATVCSLPASGAPTVPVGSGSATVAALKKALAENAPEGATPTAGALTRALQYFSTGPGAALEGARYVLLATDGGPNCNAALTCAAARCTVNMDGDCRTVPNCCETFQYDSTGPSKCLDDVATISVVEQLAKANVKTFVVGIPGTEAYEQTLDALAVSGGAVNPSAPPSYFSVSAAGGVQALSDVLTRITTGLITSCELKLAEDPPDHDQINVEIDGEAVPEGAADGWSLDVTTTPPTVVLKGATCKAVETAGAQHVDVTFGCPTVHIK